MYFISSSTDLREYFFSLTSGSFRLGFAQPAVFRTSAGTSVGDVLIVGAESSSTLTVWVFYQLQHPKDVSSLRRFLRSSRMMSLNSASISDRRSASFILVLNPLGDAHLKNAGFHVLNILAKGCYYYTIFR